MKKETLRRSMMTAGTAIGISTMLMSGCGAQGAAEQAPAEPAGKTSAVVEPGETLYQVALLQSLMLGDYHGSMSVAELKTLGNTGLGTFEGVNGEMIMLDGVVYQALSDGSVAVADDDVMIPFSDVTTFDADITIDILEETDLAALQQLLNEHVQSAGANQFYMAKIEGEFPMMQVRSEFVQSEPYKPLAEVMKTDQVIFDYENINGTIVALYCPNYMSGLNTPGWHFHFISEDKTKGGHILGLTMAGGQAQLDATPGFDMILPQQDQTFQELNLTTNLQDDIAAVEKNE